LPLVELEPDLPLSSQMPIEIYLGRGLALLVHPAAAWRRLRPSGRAILLGAYATASYVAVLTALLLAL
jgi:hypothetical protein